MTRQLKLRVMDAERRERGRSKEGDVISSHARTPRDVATLRRRAAVRLRHRVTAQTLFDETDDGNNDTATCAWVQDGATVDGGPQAKR